MDESNEDRPENDFLGDDLNEYREALREWASAHPSEFWYQVARKLFQGHARKDPGEDPYLLRIVMRWSDLLDERPRSVLRACPYRYKNGELGVAVWLEKPEPGKVRLHHGPLERFDSWPD